ncbi:MAG: M18 family aminopeptidase [SAR324 cluster bacterium]|nr:M18 family aminopeptidase [SAR324 cluster bacterium]
MKKLTKHAKSIADNLIQFLDNAPTPFHATQSIAQRLEEANFTNLKEEELWETKPGGRYYVIREDASIAGWINGKTAPASSGFRIIGAHTDSPNLRIKPNPNIKKNNYQQLGVEVYGGVLLSSWMDRDLSIAGRVMATGINNKKLTKHFVLLDSSILRIPLLAIHLNPDVNTNGLVLNRQNHLAPIFGLESKQKDPLKFLLAQELGLKSSQIIDYDLCLYDLQKADFLGPQQEFIAGSRIDNLFSCFCGLESLLQVSKRKDIPETNCMMVAFDNEEIGSLTSQGARSSFLSSILNRINHSVGQPSPQAYERSLSTSVFLSADMAHAIHPNYQEKHEPQHFPYLNEGPVIKRNAQGRYTTSGHSSAHFEMICRNRNIPVQKFVNRTDLSCGSTIGPFVASDLGITAIDIGAAMLSMHSIREMCGSLDPYYMLEAFKGFYTDA